MGEGRDSEIKMCEITRQNQMADRVQEVNHLVQLYMGYVFRRSGTIHYKIDIVVFQWRSLNA